VRAGYFRGDTTQSIVRQIIGTRGMGYKDGHLAAIKRDATILVRTATQNMANIARQETYRENDDIIRGWQFVATLDDRTCPTCGPLDGNVYGLGEGPQPPIHPQCRCTSVPALDEAFAGLEKGATRVARDADGNTVIVDADMTYYEWLKTQDADFQDAVLGKTRGALLRDGELTAKRFSELGLGREFKPRTLEEMLEFERMENAKNLEMGARSAGAAENPLIVGERYGLTREETRSILKYTTSESYQINEKLRNGIPLDAQDVELMRGLDSALEKMPSYKGTVFRSVMPADVDGFIGGHVPGNLRQFDEYVSSGVHIYDDAMPIQYVIKSKTGADIRVFNEAEGEVLFKRGTWFFVEKIENNTIFMSEI